MMKRSLGMPLPLPSSLGFRLPGAALRLWVLVLCFCPGLRAQTLTDGFYQYVVVDGGATVTGYTGPDGVVLIPGHVGGLVVTAIGAGAFQGRDAVTSVTIPGGVVALGERAFFGCSRLVSARFAGDAPTLGNEVFAAVASGFSVYYSNVATRFDSASWLSFTKVVLKRQGFVFYSTSPGNTVFYFGHGPVALQNFRTNTLLTGNSLVPFTVSFVGGPAIVSGPDLIFTGAGRFTVRYDHPGDSVYAPCSATRSFPVLFPYTYTVAAGGVTVTGYSGPGGVVTLLDEIDGLPVVGIADFAFYSAASLREIIIPEGVASIGQAAFSGCTVLERVNLPASLASIGEAAFSFCPTLSSFSVAPSNSIFASRDGILFDKAMRTLLRAPPESVVGVYTIPDGVTAIAPGALLYCFSITEVIIPAEVVSIGANAFGYCTSIREFRVATDNPNYASEGGALFDKSLVVLLNAPAGAVGAVYSVPSRVLAIGSGAFLGCFTLKSVKLPEGLLVLGSQAFADCGELGAIRIPASVVAIGEAAFYGCAKLTEARFFGDAPNVGWSAFGGVSAGFKVLFQQGAAGFSSPVWTTAGGDSLPSVALAQVDFARFAAARGLVGSAAAADADPDGDGTPNLLEYAQGASPVLADAAASRPSLAFQVVGNKPSLVFSHRRRKYSGLNFEYKTAASLSAPVASWATAKVVPTVVNPDVDGDGLVERVTVTVPLNYASQLFLGLSVSE